MAEAQQHAYCWHPSCRWSAAGLPTSADKQPHRQPHKAEQEMHCGVTRLPTSQQTQLPHG